MCDWLTIVDLDECASGQHNCHQHAVCSNSIGSVTCHCQSGYTGDGLSCEGISCAVEFLEYPIHSCLFYFVFSGICEMDQHFALSQKWNRQTFGFVAQSGFRILPKSKKVLFPSGFTMISNLITGFQATALLIDLIAKRG